MSDNHHLLSKSPISALEKIPKIAAWLNIDDPCPPDPVKTYRSSTTSNSFPTIATDTSENTLGYLKFESFRSCTLRNNGIELLRPYTTLPDWVQEHIDQVNSVEGDDIPVDIDIDSLYRNYVGLSTDRVYCLFEALDLRRRCWTDDSLVPEENIYPLRY